MKLVFQCIYYKCVALYISWGEKDTPYVYALCFISLLEMLNFFTIIIVLTMYDIISPKDVYKNRYFGVLFFLVLFVANWFYLKKGVKENEQNVNFNPKVRFIAFTYVAVTSVVFLSLFIYYIYFF